MDDRTPEIHLAEVARILHCCSRQLRAFLSEQIRPLQLSDSEFLLLWVCHRSGPQRTIQGQLVAEIGLSPAQLSGLVDRLHKRGLLQVERSDSDRRCQLLSMSPEGNLLFQKAIHAIDASSHGVAECLGDSSLGQLIELADQLLAACQHVAQASSGKTSLPPAPTGAASKGAAA